MHELIKDGIEVNDSTDGKSTSKASDREMTALANLLDDKLEDMQEGVDRGFNLMYWRDGTQDAKVFPGITSGVGGLAYAGLPATHRDTNHSVIFLTRSRPRVRRAGS